LDLPKIQRHTVRALALGPIEKNTETLKLWDRKASVMREGHFVWPTPKSKQTMTGERAMSATIKFVPPAELSIPAHPLAPKISVPQNGETSRICVLGVDTKRTESESRLWKFTAKASESRFLSVEDGLLFFFGFFAGCAVASCFSQILGLFR
jgi:hypothetical protein